MPTTPEPVDAGAPLPAWKIDALRTSILELQASRYWRGEGTYSSGRLILTGIPSDCRTLFVHLSVNSTTASAYDEINMTVNDSSSSLYSFVAQRTMSSTGVPTYDGKRSIDTTSLFAGLCQGAGDVPSAIELVITNWDDPGEEGLAIVGHGSDYGWTCSMGGQCRVDPPHTSLEFSCLSGSISTDSTLEVAGYYGR